MKKLTLQAAIDECLRNRVGVQFLPMPKGSVAMLQRYGTGGPSHEIGGRAAVPQAEANVLPEELLIVAKQLIGASFVTEYPNIQDKATA